MDEAPKEIVPSNRRAIGPTRNRFGPRLWRLQVETSMRPGLVVVSGVGPEDPLKVAPAEHEHPVQTLVPDRGTHRSANAFARGARIGVLTMCTPSVRKTSSKGPENFESRSRIRNRTS
jgi:hypothetical protein